MASDVREFGQERDVREGKEDEIGWGPIWIAVPYPYPPPHTALHYNSHARVRNGPIETRLDHALSS